MAADTGGTLAFTGRSTTSSTSSSVWANMKGAKESAVSTNGNGYLAFAVSNHNTGGLVERLRIDSLGKVGIGCTPVRDLQLHTSDASSELMLSNSTTGATAGSGFMIQQDGNDNYIWNKENSFMSFGTNALERMRINSSGNVGIGTSSAGGKLEVNFNSSVDVGLVLRNTTTGTSARFYSGTNIVGSITVTSSATAFNTSSDYRLKENVVDIAEGITRIKKLKPKRFNFIADTDTTVDGFLAHEAQAVVPEAVTGEKDGDEMQGIDQSKLVPLLTAALQEAVAKIETLETKVAALEAG